MSETVVTCRVKSASLIKRTLTFYKLHKIGFSNQCFVRIMELVRADVGLDFNQLGYMIKF